MSNLRQTGRFAPPDIDRLLREEQARWSRRPYRFLRDMPSHPEGPISYYRFRSSKTFFVRIAVLSATDDRVALRLTAEEQAGCMWFGRQPEGKAVEFTVLAPRY